MNTVLKRWVSCLLALLCFTGIFVISAGAEEITDEAVLEVIAQLEKIDSLETMQAKRSEYTASGNYDTGTTDETIAAAHTEARLGYETYVAEMFSARAAAQLAYDGLTEAQKALIDPALTAKLSATLSNIIREGTYPLTPSEDEYTFEAVDGGFGYAYEVSHYMVSGNIPQTFILVDTADGKTQWSPNGLYTQGESDYEVLYCCDIETPIAYGTDYKRVNLEDSDYYSAYAAEKIRAILLNSYPYVSIDEMKAFLKAGGLDSDFVDGLNRSDLISGVQMAVWSFANILDNDSALGYFASIDTTKNQGIYFTSYHDFNNEIWDWLPKKRQRSYDPEPEYRVNALAYFLCSLEGMPLVEENSVITDVKVTRADLVDGTDDTYRLGLYVNIKNGGDTADDIKITVTSGSTDAEGNFVTTSRVSQMVNGRTAVPIRIKANSGDTVKVTVSGTMKVDRSVYFYTPRGGRDVSQSLVGVGEGLTSVYAETDFLFKEDIGEFGLRFYKTETDSGDPISDISFSVYRAEAAPGEILGEEPTDADIERIAVEANLAASVVTDSTGYAHATLEEGTYLVVEEHNTEKVKAPVAPFFITIPMPAEEVGEDGTITVVMQNIVSLYPKNEPTEEEPPPDEPPPPDKLVGLFEIVKSDSENAEKLLSGAEFKVFKPVTSAEDATATLECGGVKYAVTEVLVNGEPLVLVTDGNGRARSPELAPGTYFLSETKAPAGYDLLKEAVSVNVVPTVMAEVTYAEIANERGSLLPETGGRGVKLLLISGGVLAVGAAVILVTRKRMSRG